MLPLTAFWSCRLLRRRTTGLGDLVPCATGRGRRTPAERPTNLLDRLIANARCRLRRRRRLCSVASTDISSTDVVRNWVGQERYSLPHTVGTCAMGNASDGRPVVDTNGRVHGAEGLAVVDALIIPVPPSGFPHVVTIMIAERLAKATTSGQLALFDLSPFPGVGTSTEGNGPHNVANGKLRVPTDSRNSWRKWPGPGAPRSHSRQNASRASSSSGSRP